MTVNKNDVPVEDHFGSEVRAGDKLFYDADRDLFFIEENIEDYLLEVQQLQVVQVTDDGEAIKNLSAVTERSDG